MEGFNRYAKLNYHCLQAFGETCGNNTTHLFKVYIVASDREIVSYIKLKKMEHKEGWNELLPEQLMTLVLNKVAILHKQNLWNIKEIAYIQDNRYTVCS